jgi:hypothetical protein
MILLFVASEIDTKTFDNVEKLVIFKNLFGIVCVGEDKPIGPA